MLKAPCKNDAGFTGSLVACSGLASAARQGTRSSVCVWLADMGILRTGAWRCSDFSADSSPTFVKKGRYFPFPSATPSSRRNVYIQRLWHIFRKRWISVSAAIRKRSYKTRIVLEMLLSSSAEIVLQENISKKRFIVIGNLWKLWTIEVSTISFFIQLQIIAVKFVNENWFDPFFQCFVILAKKKRNTRSKGYILSEKYAWINKSDSLNE